MFVEKYGLSKALEQSWEGQGCPFYRLHCGDDSPQNLSKAIWEAGYQASKSEGLAARAHNRDMWRKSNGLARFFRDLEQAIEEYAIECHGKAWRDLLASDDD